VNKIFKINWLYRKRKSFSILLFHVQR